MQFDRIKQNPAVISGKSLTFAGSRDGWNHRGLACYGGQHREWIMEAFPYLVAVDIDAAIASAAWPLEV